MQLENLIGYQSQASQEKQRTYFVVGDLESLSASVLYTGDSGSSGRVIPTSKGFVIPLGNLGIPDLKDIHDTYKVDKDGNISYGHTTFVSDKGIKRISHDD